MEMKKDIQESRGRKLLSLALQESKPKLNDPMSNGSRPTLIKDITLHDNRTLNDTTLNDDLPRLDFDFDKMEVDDYLLLQAVEETVTALQDHNYFDISMDENVSENPASASGENRFVNQDAVVDDYGNVVHNNDSVVVDENGLDDGDAVIHEIIPSVDNLEVIEIGNQTEVENSEERKRNKKPNTGKWARIANKRKREKGEEYDGIRKDGDKWQYDIVKPAKKMKNHCDCSMSKKSQKINCGLFTEECRQQLFNTFWKNMNWEQRRTHIQAMVDSGCTKDLKNQQNDISRRNSSFFYHLKINDQRIRVCKTLFTNTYGITDWVILNWLKKSQVELTEEGGDPADKQKKNKKRKSERNEKKVSDLKEFLNELPKVESHYCRKDSKRLYLEPVFQTKKQVYDLYIDNCKELNKEYVSIKKFHEEFDAKNLSIYIPRKDQCDLCTSYRMKNVEEEVYEKHLLKKELARNEKSNDNLSENHVITMGKQAILLAPSMKASALYYKSKLVVHNQTMFNNKTKEVVCYVWHEGEGGVTSNEFASVITHNIEHILKPNENETVIIWSDGCCYQNRNTNLSNSLLLLAAKMNIIIIQKYLEHGHTQMECDSIHAQIEKKLKNREIYVPANYIEIMRASRKNPQPYNVEYLSHDFFMDFSKSMVYSSIRPGLSAGDPTVTDISALKHTPNKELFFKLSFDEDWALLKKRARKSSSFENPTKLYKEPLKIKQHKYQHLQELKSVIPKDFHSFYDSLKH